ncbi:E3 ubiquitin-protein ligase [Colletotrichum trifolii]|uniref:E3 ubiquitin-protein ligase n=1 Tax=Colletotrichum trifolii TaxID=5466 RepID=A0A4R8PSG8_COLTR|nr:E3 ubiquitin-protein ligase [Colletotrichum trifolii]
MVFTKFLGSSSDMLQHAHPKPSTSAVPASKAHDTISTDTAEAAPRNGYIYDESHLRPLPSDCPDLRELNNSLDALAGLFPDVQIQVFREMLINFEEESRLAVVADALLKNRVAWVKGRWLDQRLAENSLLASSLPLVRCPFCAYAEVDDIYLPANETPLQIRVDSLVSLMFMVVCTAIMLLLLPAVLLSFLSGLLLSTKQTLGDHLLAQWSNALGRYRRRRRGLMFTCQNPGCGRSSCLSCSKSWTDIHVCNESSLVALRTQVEQAMSMAIKRVCPRCYTSFVKNSGCNKLTCPCGYKMCYVCRKDIGGSNGEGEGYRHFCDHFRPDGDPRPCTECTKCNLWESEDTDLVLRLAKEEAESKWREAEKRDLSGPERAFLEAGFGKNGTTPVHSYFQNGRLPTVVELCDFVVETVFI